MPQMGVTIKGVEKTLKWLEEKRADADKAMNTALRVEGFRLKNLMQKEIRSGAPGGRRFAPLSHIAKRGSGRRNRAPLEALAKAVRYQVNTSMGLKVQVGFVQPASGSYLLSKSWLRMAREHQAGFTRTITDAQRSWIIRRGASLLGWRRSLGGDTSYTGAYGGNLEASAGSTPFFLKKSTRTLTTPPREIISPFWQAHQAGTRRNIEQNWKRKMAGQRI
jgi:hypothetical protein